MYVIWSMEHDAWWRANGVGYTPHLAEAGHYSEVDAQRIVAKANYPPGRCHEAMIPLASVTLPLLRDVVEPPDPDTFIADRRAQVEIVEAVESRDLARVANSVGTYYSDADRCDRTSRSLMVLHLGMLTGIVAQCASTARSSTTS